MRPWLPVLLVLLALTGCSNIEGPVIVGAKNFTEQQVAAHLVAEALRARGIPAEVDPVSRDSLGAIGALWVGDVDVYVEYTGSVLALVGHPPVNAVEESFRVARELISPYGLAMTPLVGFRNDYVVLARPGSAVAARAERLSQLAAWKRPLKIGITEEFRARSRDGYEALVRRYGLRAEPAVVVPSSPEGKDALYGALLDGEIDIAIGFLTDPQILTFGLLHIEDDRGFFPAYAAAPLVREKLLARRPEVAKALEDLSQRISTADIKAMIAEVTEHGADPFAVAAEYFAPETAAPAGGVKRRAFAVALGALDAPSGQSARVLMALRKAFPERRIEVIRGTDPLIPLLESRARYALLSGPAFFTSDEVGRQRLRGPVEALVPAGFDVLHLLIPAEGEDPDWRSPLRLGVGPADGLSARTAAMLRAGVAESAFDLVAAPGDAVDPGKALRAQGQAVREGELDGVLVMAELGHPTISAMLDAGLRVAPIPVWEARGNRVRFPFLEAVTIPADTYPGQSGPLASLGSQTVLATRRSDLDEAVGVVGPGSAAIGRTLPVGAGTVARIREALQVQERLDPSLPLATAAREPPPERLSGITPSPLGSALNLAAAVVLGLMFWLYLRRPQDKRTGG